MFSWLYWKNNSLLSIHVFLQSILLLLLSSWTFLYPSDEALSPSPRLNPAIYTIIPPLPVGSNLLIIRAVSNLSPSTNTIIIFWFKCIYLADRTSIKYRQLNSYNTLCFNFIWDQLSVLRWVIPNVFIHIRYYNIICIKHMVRTQLYVTMSSILGIQLHVSALYIGNRQVVIITYQETTQNTPHFV